MAETDYIAEQGLGLDAQAILDNPLIQEWYKQIQEHLQQTLMETKVSDAEGREKIHSLMWAVNRLKIHMDTTIQDGKIATMKLLDIQKQTVLDKARELWS